jgi:general secretion pathway protein C
MPFIVSTGSFTQLSSYHTSGDTAEFAVGRALQPRGGTGGFTDDHQKMRISSISTIRTLGWPAWSVSLLLFAGVCAIAAYWAAVLLAPRAPIAPTTIVADPRALPELQQSAQLFGLSEQVAVTKLANIEVVGIVAAGRRGSAILGIDGKPPRAFAVGEELNSSQRLSAVEGDRVVIANNGRLVELPAPSTASLDVLTSGSNQPARAGAAARGGGASQNRGASLAPGGSSGPGIVPVMPRAPSVAAGSPPPPGIVAGPAPQPDPGSPGQDAAQNPAVPTPPQKQDD